MQAKIKHLEIPISEVFFFFLLCCKVANSPKRPRQHAPDPSSDPPSPSLVLFVQELTGTLHVGTSFESALRLNTNSHALLLEQYDEIMSGHKLTVSHLLLGERFIHHYRTKKLMMLHSVRHFSGGRQRENAAKAKHAVSLPTFRLNVLR